MVATLAPFRVMGLSKDMTIFHICPKLALSLGIGCLQEQEMSLSEASIFDQGAIP